MNSNNPNSNSQIFVLSIAINEYESESVSNLFGCVKDIERIQTTLKKKYNILDQNFKTLINSKATRKNIIQTFRTHFANLKDGDTALLHYSGHGSREPTTKEFVDANIEYPGGKNEVLVVHDYSPDGTRNIADKELRMLISELQYKDGERIKDVHFVGLMDCCYSGSIFKDMSTKELVRRIQLPKRKARKMEEYLEGQYYEMAKNNNLHIPNADFILLTACGPRETAGEDDNGGLFSFHLNQILDQDREIPPSYADLYVQLNDAIYKRVKKLQHPYFKYAGNVNPYTSFLKLGPTQYQGLPLIKKKGDKWIANIGAIHGLDSNNLKGVEFPLFKVGQLDEVIGTAEVSSIAIETTTVSPKFKDVSIEKGKFQIALSGKKLGIQIEDNSTNDSNYNKLIAEIHNRGIHHRIQWVDASKYVLSIQADEITLKKDDEIITGIKNINERGLSFLVNNLYLIANWETINQISAPKRSLLRSEKISLDFSWSDVTKVERGPITVFPFENEDGEETGITNISIPFKEETKYITFKFNIKNLNKHPFFVYLVHLGEDYSMSQKFEDFNKKILFEFKALAYSSREKKKILTIPSSTIDNAKDTFLLICSKDSLRSPHLFKQNGIEHFGKVMDSNTLEFSKEQPLKTENYEKAFWTVKRFEVNLNRE